MAVGKKITDLTASGSLKDTDLTIVHDGNGTKRSTLTQLGEYMGTKFSNPNLLTNPDFKINQRGATSYSSNGYTVDRWKISNGTVNTSPSGVTVTLNKKGQFIQILENALNGTYTATIKVTSITGNCMLYINSHSIQLNKADTFTITENGSITGISLYNNTENTCTISIEYIKLEKGLIATPFVAPNPAEELVKCKRFFNRIYFYHVFYSGTAKMDYSFSHVIQSMRTKPTVTFNVENHYGLSNQQVTANNTKGLTVVVTATTSKIGDCNISGTVDLDAEIY